MKNFTDEEIDNIAKSRFLFLRQKLDVSQREMAKTIGYAQSKISGLESGRAKFSHVIMTRISEKFNISFDYFNPLIEDYEKILENREKELSGITPPENIENLAKENDTFDIPYVIHISYRNRKKNSVRKDTTTSFTWKKIIKFVAPGFIVPAPFSQIFNAVKDMIIRTEKEKHAETDIAIEDIQGYELSMIMLQLIALGILRKVDEDTSGIVLKLTPYGEKYMMDVCTIKK